MSLKTLLNLKWKFSRFDCFFMLKFSFIILVLRSFTTQKLNMIARLHPTVSFPQQYVKPIEFHEYD